MLETIHKNFRLLKVLHFESNNELHFGLPDEMGNLTFLRYLSINVRTNCKLPKSLGNLQNLLTFNFSNFFSNNKILSNVFWKMEKLHHLFLADPNSFPEEGFKLETLKNLKTLWGVVGGNWMLKEMSTLSQTVTKLCIQEISSMEQLESIFKCPSVTSGLLQRLDLQWKGATHLRSQNLELLCRCELLHDLSLNGRISEGFSSPVQFHSSLMKLDLYETFLALQETMSTLGKLSNLRYLNLSDESYIGTEWTCNAGEFPQLEYLYLSGLQYLEEWRIEAGATPRLSFLYMFNCINMKRLPEGLRHTTTLQELKIVNMPKEFCKRLRQADNNGEIANQGGEDLHIIQHIPLVTFDDM